MKYNLGQEFSNIEVDENKLNEIKELLGLETEWKPKDYEIYWTIQYAYGRWRVEKTQWDDGDYDTRMLNNKVIFKTEEEAQEEANKRNFLQQMAIDFEANSDEVDWEDTNQKKHYIIYSHNTEDIYISSHSIAQTTDLYTTDKEWLKQYIKDNEENIKRYYFGISDD